MALFKKTNTKIYAKPTQKLTPDNVYWRKLGAPVILKEFGPIDFIDFSPVEPYYFAITCSVRVQLYNPYTKAVHKTLSNFKESAYGARIRSDGQLVCSGGEEAAVKLFDINTKSLLRVFKGHTGPVHRCNFTLDKTHIVSFSDDKTCRLWDIPSEKVVQEFSAHQDYIRAGAVSPVSPDVFVSGSYDRKLCMYDSRTSNEPTFTMDHGSPVEALIFLPSGGIVISAGGTEMRVWDVLAGGRLLARVSQHHKTITSLCLGSNDTRIMSGSLDRHVKIYDVSTYKVVHNIDYPNSILSIGLSKNDDILAVGMVDGMVSVSKRELEATESSAKKATSKRDRIFYRYAADKYIPPPSVDTTVALENKTLQSKHDVCLRKFQYSKALDCVLMPYVMNKTPHITVSVMQELIRRKGLHNALASKEGKPLISLLRFLIRYLGDYRFTDTLIDVSNILIDAQEKKINEASPTVLELFKRLMKRIQEEEELTKEMTELSGAVEMLLAVSSLQSAPLPSNDQALAPSQNAAQNIVLNV